MFICTLVSAFYRNKESRGQRLDLLISKNRRYRSNIGTCERDMSAPRVWCVIFVVIAACTCGARTECGKTAQISFLTSVHDDPSCTKLSTKGVMLYEAANLLVENYNNKTDGFEIGKSESKTLRNAELPEIRQPKKFTHCFKRYEIIFKK